MTAPGNDPHRGDRAFGTAIMIRATIDSDFAAGRDVQKRILDEVKRLDFDGESQFGIKLALEEALINAIKHGNKLDKSKRVQVVADITAERADITIEDEGPGFDRGDVPDPTLEENLDKCSGRGILLIEAYMTSAKWSKNGRRLHMVRVNKKS